MKSTALQVFVIDDEPLARSRLKVLVSQCQEPPCVLCGEAGEAMGAMTALRSTHADVVLLDIHMPGADGLQLARELRVIRPELAIVFVTAHAQHAVDAFDLDVTDYLTKPVRAVRLHKALQKVLARKMQPTQAMPEQAAALLQKFVIIQDRGRTERVPLADVLYFKAELKYVTVRTARRSFILDGALADLEEQYRDAFLRIHRSTLVAKRELRALERIHADSDEEDGEAQERWAVRLKSCEEPLLVSRRLLSSVRAEIAQG